MSVLSFVKNVFPPPRYITLPNVGIDVSDNSLKYVQFERKHAHDKRLELKCYGDLNIPSGVLERGVVKDAVQLGNILSKVRESCESVYARVSLPEERAYIFETTVEADTPFKEIRGLLEFKLEENVPIPPREAFFDYDIVEIDEEEHVLRIVVMVYSKEVVEGYQNACTKAGIVPLSFEVEAQGIARAVVAPDYDDTYMIIDFGKARTGVGIVHKKSLMYTSTIDIGGIDLSKALRSVLGDLAESELTMIKNTQGLILTHEHEKERQAIAEVISSIQSEIETRIHYWHTRDIESGERDIQKIILCGGSSNLAGLTEYLSRSLLIPVERAEVWNNAFSVESFIPPIDKRLSYGYATAIGLALTDFLSLDL